MNNKKIIAISVVSIIAIALIITIILILNKDNSASVSVNNISENETASENALSDNTVSDNIEDNTSNDISDISDNSDDISISGDTVSDNNIENDDKSNEESKENEDEENANEDKPEETTSVNNITSENTETTSQNKVVDTPVTSVSDANVNVTTAPSNTTSSNSADVSSNNDNNITAVPVNYNVRINRYNNIINTDVVIPDDPKYSLYVNKSLNTVTVFIIDANGNEIPYKAMLCSCGRSGHGTPSGTFATSQYYEWRLMVDNTYGKYAVRFNNKILFHSVPYLETRGDSLEWDQFNLLGSNASLGCVRMAVIDVKWIYENCKKGTKVVVYSDEQSPGPLGKPEPIKIPIDSPYRDWDPTDPDPINPWNNL